MMRFGAGIHPARADCAAHPSFLQAQDRIGRENRRLRIGIRRVLRIDTGGCKQPVQIVVGRVVRLVTAALPHEIRDIAEILADQQKLGPSMPEPLLPMTDHIGIEVEFGAAPDPAGAALHTDPARFPRRYQRPPLLLHSHDPVVAERPSTAESILPLTLPLSR
jgi:hypothetical protein